jgi:hypothetical protein
LVFIKDKILHKNLKGVAVYDTKIRLYGLYIVSVHPTDWLPGEWFLISFPINHAKNPSDP